ncbi:hypothetical protein BDZ91DRAFT_727765 [Kalaharituber pfeilii]|nr:hypothetical protein BDZ91DRAFT_727765 [Kalaharituber pfeilii]
MGVSTSTIEVSTSTVTAGTSAFLFCFLAAEASKQALLFLLGRAMVMNSQCCLKLSLDAADEWDW